MKNITFHGIVTYEWRHARDLDLEPREIRRAVSEFNDKFGTDRNHRYYIISGQKGYKLTKKKALPKAALSFFEFRAILKRRRQAYRGSKYKPTIKVWIAALAYSAFLRFAGAILSASRYLATVRRAHSMPCSFNISAIWLSDSGFLALSADTNCLIRARTAVLEAFPPVSVPSPEPKKYLSS